MPIDLGSDFFMLITQPATSCAVILVPRGNSCNYHCRIRLQTADKLHLKEVACPEFIRHAGDARRDFSRCLLT